MLQILSEKSYNLYYHISSYLITPFNPKLSSPLFLLGQSYQNPQELTQFVDSFQDIVWLTYTNQNPELFENQNSDTGWGCMIRVGQMMFAQILKRYSNYAQPELFADYEEDQNGKILQSQQNHFSIKQIILQGNKQFNIKPGDWFKPNESIYSLSYLYDTQNIQNYQNLKILVFNDSMIDWKQIFNSMIGQSNNKKDSPQKSQIFKSSKIQLGQNQENEFELVDLSISKAPQDSFNIEDQFDNNHQMQNAVSIIILTRIGLDKCEKNYLEVINELIELPQFNGMAGAIAHRALYFVGRQNNNYIYLDPHYVQQSFSVGQAIQFKNQKTRFSCKQLNCKRNADIDPSLSLCFYIQNLESLKSFYYKIKELRQSYCDNFFIAMKGCPSVNEVEQFIPQGIQKLDYSEDQDFEEIPYEQQEKNMRYSKYEILE